MEVASDVVLTEMVHAYVYGKYNGSGRVVRDLTESPQKVRIIGYDGVFPSMHRDDTDAMLLSLEALLAEGQTRGEFEQRRKNVRWTTTMRKEETGL